jgi:hypothetical protein
MLAAVKACGPAAILSHMPAATLWGFADRDEERAPEVTVIGDGARSHPGIRIHRTARIDRCDWRMWQAIPVTTPARTMLDISATVDGKPLRSLVRRAQGTGSVGLRQLCEVVERLGPRKGSRRLALAIVGGPARREACSRTWFSISCSTAASNARTSTGQSWSAAGA